MSLMQKTITISMRKETHAQLKLLAGKKGISMMAYLEILIDYVKRSGLDIEAPLDHQPNKQLASIKKQTDHLVRVIKSLETKTLGPLCESIFGLERSLLASATWEKELTCPSCHKPYHTFSIQETKWECNNCHYQIRRVFGQLILNEVDLLTLIGGGMTRWLSSIPLPSGEAIAGRLYLETLDPFDLKVWQDVHQNQPI